MLQETGSLGRGKGLGLVSRGMADVQLKEMSPGSVLPALVLSRLFPVSVEVMIRKEATKDGSPDLPLPLENCEGQR